MEYVPVMQELTLISMKPVMISSSYNWKHYNLIVQITIPWSVSAELLWGLKLTTSIWH